MGKRTWPQGRAGPEDDGETQLAIAVDEKHKIVQIEFPNPTLWIGLDLKSAQAFRVMLDKCIEKLEEIT